MPDWFYAIVMGILEGLTEFIPVSSTAHQLLAKEAMDLTDDSWNTFIVMNQLGAILALVTLYFGRLWKVAITLNQAASRRFVFSVLVGVAPAFVAGLLMHGIIKGVFFESLSLICWSLIVGGVVLLFIERVAPKPVHTDAMAYPIWISLGIGLFQCLALFPGVSRSGATIVGARLLRADNRSGAEFSFFMAMPLMVGAFTLDAWKNRDAIDPNQMGLIAIGFVAALIAGALVVKTLLGFVQKRGLVPFGLWRIAVGAAGLIWIV